MIKLRQLQIILEYFFLWILDAIEISVIAVCMYLVELVMFTGIEVLLLPVQVITAIYNTYLMIVIQSLCSCNYTTLTIKITNFLAL